jgi:hypothetical protein
MAITKMLKHLLFCSLGCVVCRVSGWRENLRGLFFRLYFKAIRSSRASPVRASPVRASFYRPLPKVEKEQHPGFQRGPPP